MYSNSKNESSHKNVVNKPIRMKSDTMWPIKSSTKDKPPRRNEMTRLKKPHEIERFGKSEGKTKHTYIEKVLIEKQKILPFKQIDINRKTAL